MDPREAAREKLREMIQKHLDVGDGVGWFDVLYKAAAGDPSIIPWADLKPNHNLVVWLDLPLRIVLARVVRRTARRVRTREQVLGTNVETWRNFFFARNPLWLWVFQMHFRWRRRLPGILARYPHVRLRSERDVERFLAEA